MRMLAHLATIEAGSVVALLLIAVAVQLMDGRIRTAGLLCNKATSALDAGRLQLLVMTLLVAGLLVSRLEEMRGRMVIALPSTGIAYAMSGSQLLYVIRKYVQTFPRPWGRT
jgi:hypothetical protein